MVVVLDSNLYYHIHGLVRRSHGTMSTLSQQDSRSFLIFVQFSHSHLVRLVSVSYLFVPAHFYSRFYGSPIFEFSRLLATCYRKLGILLWRVHSLQFFLDKDLHVVRLLTPAQLVLKHFWYMFMFYCIIVSGCYILTAFVVSSAS